MVNPGKKKKEDLDVWDTSRDKWDLRRIAEIIEEEKSFKFISDDDTDQLFVFEDGIWKEKGESVIRRKALELSNNLLRSRNIGQIKTIIKSRNEIYIDEDGFEAKDYVVPFKNGVYDVKEQEFREFRKDDNFTFKHNVEYIEDKQEYAEQQDIELEEYEEKTNEFLWNLQDTERKVQILKESAALALLSNYPIDEAPILYGSGSNGKNMFVEVLSQMTEAGHSINLDQMTDDKFAKKELENKTYVFFDEMANVNDPNQVKQFIGNEEMRVRPMRDTGYMTKQRAFPVLAANEIPKAPEQTDGFFRRFQIVDFPYQFTSQDNDGKKDKKSRGKLKEEYMNQHALNLFASEVVKYLPEVIEQEGFTESYSTDATRQQWNIKSSPVYSFLDQFVEQGDLPEYGSKTNSDKIEKSVLLEMANEYIEGVNGTKLRQHELTKAIHNNPDLELGSDGRIELNSGSRVRAYTGVKLVLPKSHEAQAHSDLVELTSVISLKYWQHIDNAASYQAAQGLGVAECTEVSQTVKYLESLNKDQINLLELVAQLKFNESQVQKVLDSPLISTLEKDSEKIDFPQIEIDQEAFDKAVKEAGYLSHKTDKVKTLNDWIRDYFDSFSKSTIRKIGEVVQDGVEIGFDESDIEEKIESLKDDGYIYSPQPGKVQKLD